jgi:glycerol-3-phosphate cytidylyltransferase-like family protein
MLIAGYFDPLHAVHVRRLRELSKAGATLVVAIDDPPDPLLPRAARAELAASVASVDYVVCDIQSAIETLADADFHDLRAEDAEQRKLLCAYVARRNRGE